MVRTLHPHAQEAETILAQAVLRMREGRHFATLNCLCACAVPQQLLPRLLSAGQFKCPHCRTTQGLPEGLGMQREAQLMSGGPERVCTIPDRQENESLETRSPATLDYAALRAIAAYGACIHCIRILSLCFRL